jgi:hypothetical protein
LGRLTKLGREEILGARVAAPFIALGGGALDGTPWSQSCSLALEGRLAARCASDRANQRPTEVVNIAKKTPQTTPQKKDEGSSRGKRILKIKKGARVEFPVKTDHSHAGFQEVAPVKTPKDLAPFGTLWESRARTAGREFIGVESALGALSAASVEELTVARIQATEFVVPEGSTVVLSHPLNHLKFDKVEIKGVLVCQGDVVLECENLS